MQGLDFLLLLFEIKNASTKNIIFAIFTQRDFCVILRGSRVLTQFPA